MTGGVGARTVCIIAALCCCINRCWGYRRADQVEYLSNYNVLITPIERNSSNGQVCMGSFVGDGLIVTSALCLGTSRNSVHQFEDFELGFVSAMGNRFSNVYRFRRWANFSLPPLGSPGDKVFAVHPRFASHNGVEKSDLALIGGSDLPRLTETGHAFVQLPPENSVQSNASSIDCYFSGDQTHPRSDWVVRVRIVEFSACSLVFGMTPDDDKICVEPIDPVPPYRPMPGRGLVCKYRGLHVLAGVESRGFRPDSRVRVSVFTKTIFAFL